MILIIVPAPKGYYIGMVDGKAVTEAVTEPLFVYASTLVKQGCDPETILTMRHQGSEIDSLSGTIGRLAKLHEMNNSKKSKPSVRQMDVAARVMERRRNALRELAEADGEVEE